MISADLPVPALKVYLAKLESPAFVALRPMQRFDLAGLARHVHIADEVDGGEAARVWRDIAIRLARRCIAEHIDNRETAVNILVAWMDVINTVMFVGADGKVVTP